MKIIIFCLFIASIIFLKGIFSIVFLAIDTPYEQLLALKIITLIALCGLGVLGLVWLRKRPKAQRPEDEKN